MTTAELLTHLRKLKVALSADNGQLIFNGPKGALTQSLRAELSGRKAEILELLKKAGAAGATPAESNLRRVSRDKELPLSFAQQRLWFCLAYIKEVWTDMRPLSLCKKIEARQAKD